MLARLLAAAMCCLPLQAFAGALLGYGVSNQIETEAVPEISGGLELRAMFGGDHGDRWNIWLGAQPERVPREQYAYGLYVDEMPAHWYVAGTRRFNLHLDGPVTLFAGTGLGYRDLSTCLIPAYGEPPSAKPLPCFDGDAFVSSRWAFAQELGFRWRVVEMSLAHFSTGGISLQNHGVNYWRFTLLGHVGGKR